MSDGEAEEQTIIDAFKDNSSITLNDTAGEPITVCIMQSDIPSLYLDLNGTTLSEIHADKDIKHPGNNVIIKDPAGGNNLTAANVEIKGRGNTSWVYFDKKGYCRP